MIKGDIVKEIEMTIRCYLKNEANPKIGLSPNGLFQMHHATGLRVYTDGRGYYVPVECDLFQEPTFELREDLACDVQWYSAKIEVDLPGYTRNFMTDLDKSYDCGDPDVRLTVSSHVKSVEEVFYREMTLRAPTLEKIKAAIEKIRRGEITPIGREQTVLEMREIALAQVESTNNLLSAEVLRLTRVLDATECHAATFAEDVSDITSFIAGKTDKLRARSAQYDIIVRELQRVARSARSLIDEHRRITNSRWHRVGEFFASGTPNTGHDM